MYQWSLLRFIFTCSWPHRFHSVLADRSMGSLASLCHGEHRRPKHGIMRGLLLVGASTMANTFHVFRCCEIKWMHKKNSGISPMVSFLLLRSGTSKMLPELWQSCGWQKSLLDPWFCQESPCHIEWLHFFQTWILAEMLQWICWSLAAGRNRIKSLHTMAFQVCAISTNATSYLHNEACMLECAWSFVSTHVSQCDVWHLAMSISSARYRSDCLICV